MTPMPNKMTDSEIKKALDILEKLDFFGGQRAGRELWSEKPADIQNKDIESFSNDAAFLKDFINRQKAEIEALTEKLNATIAGQETLQKDCINPDSFGMICVHCNACGRIDKSTMWESRYHFYYDRLKELLNKYDDDFFKSNLQQTNIASDIVHFGKKIKECVAHIDFDGMDAFEIKRSDNNA